MKYNSSVYIEHGKSKDLIDVGLEIHDNKQARNKRGKKKYETPNRFIIPTIKTLLHKTSYF
jgi:hypothetical protein